MSEKPGPEAWARRVVGLTGVIGSGKTAVATRLRERGAFIVSADELARHAVAPGSEGLAAIEKEFGPAVIADDGSLDRSALGEIVFVDVLGRKRLEGITHPVVRRLAREAFEGAFADDHPLYVYDVPLLFEAGLDALGFMAIVVVAAPPETCRMRIVTRDGLDPEVADRWIAAQFPIEEKRRRADHVIDNDAGLEELEEKVGALYATLTA